MSKSLFAIESLSEPGRLLHISDMGYYWAEKIQPNVYIYEDKSLLEDLIEENRKAIKFFYNGDAKVVEFRKVE